MENIIINGVDVSGCEKYEHEIVRCNATLKNMCFCGGRCTDEKNANCYFKQLKRKEQKIEKIKDIIIQCIKNTKCAYCKYDDECGGYLSLSEMILKIIEGE